jgi:ABC-type nitrate/sulfonate/bicarbonate transport system substrate-binding protein
MALFSRRMQLAISPVDGLNNKKAFMEFFENNRLTKSLASMALMSSVLLAASGCASAPEAPKVATPVDIVVGSNLGHLPLLVGVEKGLFAKHGIDLRLKVVNNGGEMVAAMQKREVELGNMSVTTFIKAKHEGDALQVIGLIMNDATRSNADDCE